MTNTAAVPVLILDPTNYFRNRLTTQLFSSANFNLLQNELPDTLSKAQVIIATHEVKNLPQILDTLKNLPDSSSPRVFLFISSLSTWSSPNHEVLIVLLDSALSLPLTWFVCVSCWTSTILVAVKHEEREVRNCIVSKTLCWTAGHRVSKLLWSPLAYCLGMNNFFSILSSSKLGPLKMLFSDVL